MTRKTLIWAAVLACAFGPVVLAAFSPLLAWRDATYIAAGFVGVVSLSVLLLQPLLARGALPGLGLAQSRKLHRWTGTILLVAVLFHVAGLWITSPPDVIDALLFRSPTSFAPWGVVAMWAVFASAALAVLKLWRRMPLRLWRRAHSALAIVIVVGTVVHAILIEGTMEVVSKSVLCFAIVVVTAKTIFDLKPWGRRPS